MSKKSGPKAPDPVKTANAQGAANKDAARETILLNQVDQLTPFGNVTFRTDPNALAAHEASGSTDPFDPAKHRQQVTELNPASQNALDNQQALTELLSGKALSQGSFVPDTQFSLDGLPQLSDTTDLRNRTEQAVFDRGRALLDPVFQQQRDETEQNISDRGLPFMGENATTLRDDLSRNQNQSFENLANSAVTAGGNEATRQFGLDQSTRQQAISDLLLERTQPINEVSAFLQGTPALNTPQGTAVPQAGVQAPDIAGLIQNNFAQKQNASNSSLGSVAGLAGAGIGGLLGGPFGATLGSKFFGG